MVSRAARIGRELGCEIATPAEARHSSIKINVV
ncbi:hypothetical protein ACFLVS_00775 [Chloroflexota bacterium]